jgi:hypothetical protein
MEYYKRTTQVPNEVIDVLMKQLPATEFKVLLLIIRRTYGMIEQGSKHKRVQRTWISQKLFCICCNVSGRAVSTAIEKLIQKKLITVTDFNGNILDTKQKRRGKPRLYFTSRLRLEPSSFKKKKKACELTSTKPMNTVHMIKPTEIKQSFDMITQGIERITDQERIQQILKLKLSSPQTNQKSTNPHSIH